MSAVLEPARSNNEVDQLVQMLLGSSREELWRLWQPEDEHKFVDQLSSALAEAVRTAEHTPAFRTAIAPVITDGVMSTARRQPQKIGDALAPALGPAIRSMVRLAMDDINERIESGVRQTFSIDGLRWRWEAMSSGVAFGDVVLQHTRQYRVEHVMLIHRESGTLLSDTSRPDYQGKDAAVVASMLSAVTHFVADAFVPSQDLAGSSEDDGLEHRQFEVGSFVVKVEVLGELIIAAVVRGTPAVEVTTSMVETLELLQSVVGADAARFDGDLAPFSETEHILQDCLIEQKRSTPVKSEAPAAKSRVGRWLALSVLALGVAGLSWDMHQRAQSFADYKTLMDQQPGLVITKLQRLNLFGRPAYKVSGMLDPHALHPAALPRDTVFDVSWDLRAYLSLDSEITTRRAVAALQPSSQVQVTVKGATLQLSGIASQAWFKQAQEIAIPGVMQVDSSRLFLL